MQSYKLKLTALTPIHIGTGEVYEPTNFVIDDGWLYEFDEVLFFKILPQPKRQQFTKLVTIESKNGNEYFEKIHAFFIENKEYAKKVVINKVKVSNAFENKYKKDIAKKVQIENTQKNNKYKPNNVFNKFEIQKTQREPNNVSTFLAGSSIKGAISTAYQEMIFKKGAKEELDKSFKTDKVFRNLSISDTLVQKANSQIAFSINQELFEDDSSEISTMIEVNSKDSEYLATLDIKSFLNDDSQEIKEKITKEKITKEKIIKACNEHYNIIYENKEHKKINLNSDQFLLSVGKHSGARAVTIDGLRKISVKLCQIQNKRDEGDDANARVERLKKKSYFESTKIANLFADKKLLDDKEIKKWETAKHFIENPSKIEWLIENNKRVTINAILTQETTVWKFSENKQNGDSFGWLLCEFIDEKAYTHLYNEYSKYQQELVYKNNQSRDKVIENLKKAKEEQKAFELAKKKAKEDEEKAEQTAQANREAELASMTPIQKLIDSYDDIAKLINDMRAGAIEDLENIKIELAEEIKKELQKTSKTWNKAKKKALDRKIYIEKVLQ